MIHRTDVEFAEMTFKKIRRMNHAMVTDAAWPLGASSFGHSFVIAEKIDAFKFSLSC